MRSEGYSNRGGETLGGPPVPLELLSALAGNMTPGYPEIPWNTNQSIMHKKKKSIWKTCLRWIASR